MARVRLGRDRKGRFLRRSSSRALVRRRPASVARRSTRRSVALAPRRRRRGRSGGGGGGARPLRAQLWDFGASAAYGWLTGPSPSGMQEQAQDILRKAPVVAAIGAPATHGLILHGIALYTGGMFRRVAGHLSHAALMRASYNLGAAKFSVSEAASLGDDESYAGDLDIEGDDEGDED